MEASIWDKVDKDDFVVKFIEIDFSFGLEKAI